jgi:hypothetical protein
MPRQTAEPAALFVRNTRDIERASSRRAMSQASTSDGECLGSVANHAFAADADRVMTGSRVEMPGGIYPPNQFDKMLGGPNACCSELRAVAGKGG